MPIILQHSAIGFGSLGFKLVIQKRLAPATPTFRFPPSSWWIGGDGPSCLRASIHRGSVDKYSMVGAVTRRPIGQLRLCIGYRSVGENIGFTEYQYFIKNISIASYRTWIDFEFGRPSCCTIWLSGCNLDQIPCTNVGLKAMYS